MHIHARITGKKYKVGAGTLRTRLKGAYILVHVYMYLGETLKPAVVSLSPSATPTDTRVYFY